MLKMRSEGSFVYRVFPAATLLALITGIFFFYIWRLGTLTPGFSQSEIDARSASSNFSEIVENPLFGPHKIVQWAFQSIGENGAFWMRLTSVFFGLAFLLFFYFLLKLWFGKFISLIGTILLAATPSLILASRSATPDVLYLIPIAIIASFVWLTRTERKNLAWLILMSVTAISLYVPGMAVLSLLSLAVLYKPLVKTLRSVSLASLAGGFVTALFLIAPLVFAIVKDLALLRQWLLVPEYWDGAFVTAKSTAWSVLALFLRARENSAYIIDSLPLLSGIQVILIIFGLYALFSRAKKEFYLILVVVAIAVILAGLNDNSALLLSSLPVLGILAATGLRYLYKEWRGVFPINPLPRALAVFLMVAVVAVQLLYGIRYALIAWPHTEATRSTYNVLK